MQKVAGALKRYNANANDKRVGDCVKRALSLALGMTYNEISSKLNQYRTKLGLSSYTDSRVHMALMHDLGYVPVRSSEYPLLEEFADQHPTGTYVLGVTDKDPSRGSNHLVTVINGDIYDSWDSTKTKVVYYYEITHDPVTLPEAVDIADYQDQINAGVAEYLKKLSAKNEWANFELVSSIRYDRYTAELTIRVDYTDAAMALRRLMRLRTDYSFKDVVAKISPRGLDDTGLAKLVKSINQRIYDWWWTVADTLKGLQYARDGKSNPKFRGDWGLLRKLPEWVRPFVTYIRYDANTYGYKYQLYMEPLPEDPYAHGKELSFQEDTLSELKADLQYYQQSYKQYD